MALFNLTVIKTSRIRPAANGNAIKQMLLALGWLGQPEKV